MLVFLGAGRYFPGCHPAPQVGSFYLSGFYPDHARWGGSLRHPNFCKLIWFRFSGSPARPGILLFTYIWVRGTLPRFRYDQLMHFAWTFLFPCALINLLLTAFGVALF